jgi:ribonuclease BN (tRNA processing enzyme)
MVHATPVTLGSLRELLALTIPGVEDWLGKRLSWSELTPGQPAQAGDAVVIPFEVNHGLECVGFRVEQAGSVMVFAGDARPCPNVVRYAKGADLLVHEAYGPECSAKQAHAFGHSTAAEAGRAAGEAKVGRLVLTHLRASRHAAPEELATEAAHAFGGPVAAARDLDAFDF